MVNNNGVIFLKLIFYINKNVVFKKKCMNWYLNHKTQIKWLVINIYSWLINLLNKNVSIKKKKKNDQDGKLMWEV